MIWSSIPRRTTVNTSLLHETGWYLLLLQTQFTNVAQDQWQQPRSNKKVKLNYNFILFFKQVCWISLLNCSWLKGNRAIPAISAFKADRKRTYSEKQMITFSCSLISQQVTTVDGFACFALTFDIRCPFSQNHLFICHMVILFVTLFSGRKFHISLLLWVLINSIFE